MFCTIDWTQKIDKVTIGPGDHRWQGMTERHFIQAAKDLASAKSGCRFALGAKMSTWEHTHRLCQIEAQAGQTSQHCFKTVCSISSRMAWDWCKMVCSSVVKILVKLDLDRLSQPRVIIPYHSRSWGPGPANARSKTTGLLQGQASLPSSANFLAY